MARREVKAEYAQQINGSQWTKAAKKEEDDDDVYDDDDDDD